MDLSLLNNNNSVAYSMHYCQIVNCFVKLFGFDKMLYWYF